MIKLTGGDKVEKLNIFFFCGDMQIVKKIKCKDGSEIPVNNFFLDKLEDAVYIDLFFKVDSIMINHIYYKILRRGFSLDTSRLDIFLEEIK
jgi:hypothetical protein